MIESPPRIDPAWTTTTTTTTTTRREWWLTLCLVCCYCAFVLATAGVAVWGWSLIPKNVFTVF